MTVITAKVPVLRTGFLKIDFPEIILLLLRQFYEYTFPLINIVFRLIMLALCIKALLRNKTALGLGDVFTIKMVLVA